MNIVFLILLVLFELAAGAHARNLAVFALGLNNHAKSEAQILECTGKVIWTPCNSQTTIRVGTNRTSKSSSTSSGYAPGTSENSGRTLRRAIQSRPNDQQRNGPADVASKPPAGSRNGTVCFASYWGNDGNDGLSLGTAMHSIMACYDALPSGGGFIYIYDGGGDSFPVSAASVAGCGIWIMGPNDPNFGSPPTCWRKVKPVTFVGAGGTNSTTHILAGSAADQNHPAIWLSGTAASLRFENLSYQYPNVGIRLGCNSRLNCFDGTGGVSGARFDNVVGHINSSAGNGPNVFIGSNSFWIFFYNCGFAGNPAEQVKIANLSRTSNLLTITTSAAFKVTVGERIGIVLADDSTFDGSFAVASVIDDRHFTVVQTGSNASASGGTLVTDKQIPIVIDPGTGTGSGLIYVSGQSGGSTYSMGGVRLWDGINGGGVYVDHITVEGDFSHQVAPGVWIVASSGTLNVRVDSVEMADTLQAIPAVKTECNGCYPNLGDRVVVTRVDGAEGPHSGFGSTPNLTNFAASPLRQGFEGAANGQLVGQTDAARRLFSPAVRPHGALNIANNLTSTWTSAAGTITRGIAAPDGTSNAAQIAGAGGNMVIPVTGGPPLAQNTIYIFGAWVRSVSANGYTGGNPLRFDTNANGFGAGNVCNTSGIGQARVITPNYSDGQWNFVVGLCKLVTVGTTIGLELAVQSNETQTAQVYGPVVYGFPPGAISDNEAYEIMNDLASVPYWCPAASSCQMLGEDFSVGGSTPFAAEITHANTANRKYLMPDVSGTISLVLTGTTGYIGGSALAAGQCASGLVMIAGATSSMTVSVGPNTYPGEGFIPWGYISSSGTVTVKVCASVAGVPAKATYNVRVVQ